MAGDADAQFAGEIAQGRGVKDGVARLGPQVVDDVGVGVGGVGLARQQGVKALLHGVIVENALAGIVLGDFLGKPVSLLQGNGFDFIVPARADQQGGRAQILTGGVELIAFVPEIVAGKRADHVDVALGGHLQSLVLGHGLKMEDQAAFICDMFEEVRHHAGKKSCFGVRIFQRSPGRVIGGPDDRLARDKGFFLLGKHRFLLRADRKIFGVQAQGVIGIAQ